MAQLKNTEIEGYLTVTDDMHVQGNLMTKDFTDVDASLNSIGTDVKNLKDRDYIVEQGVTDQWIYRKWNSGIGECWGNFYVSTTCNTQWSGTSMYESPNITLPYFPFAFVSTPVPTLNWLSLGKGALLQFVMNVSNTWAGNTMLLRPKAEASIAGYITMHYIGRWK